MVRYYLNVSHYFHEKDDFREINQQSQPLVGVLEQIISEGQFREKELCMILMVLASLGAQGFWPYNVLLSSFSIKPLELQLVRIPSSESP